jgi:DNA-directed RNA polymerase subunit F
MEEFIYINFIDSDDLVPFILTYAIHKDLHEYLSAESKLLDIFNDTAIANEVLKICLSERNDLGVIIREFKEFQTVDAKSTIELLDYVFDHLQKFFLLHKEKVENVVKKLQTNQKPSSSWSENP